MICLDMRTVYVMSFCLLISSLHQMLLVLLRHFLHGLKAKKANLTQQFLAEQYFHYAIGIQLFRRGTRFNSEPLACLGWQLCSPLIHCRNHPKYQQLDILAEIDRVSQPSELRDFLARNFVVSRSRLLFLLAAAHKKTHFQHVLNNFFN